jgi:hypothetical protein
MVSHMLVTNVVPLACGKEEPQHVQEACQDVNQANDNTFNNSTSWWFVDHERVQSSSMESYQWEWCLEQILWGSTITYKILFRRMRRSLIMEYEY